MSTPIILVPGFWLGAWAWDGVSEVLEATGHDVTSLTLPGLESPDADRSSITIEDHVDAICAALRGAEEPSVLVLHSGSGFPGYAATDRMPEAVAAVIYVDTGAGIGAMNPEFDGDEFPLPPFEVLSEEENLDGLSKAQIETFYERAIPQPGDALRGSVDLTNPERLEVPTTVVCTSFTADQYKEAVDEGYPFVKGLAELRKVTYLDVPTSHWPMWSKPEELARIIDEVALEA